jgi:hypothetical protein
VAQAKEGIRSPTSRLVLGVGVVLAVSQPCTPKCNGGRWPQESSDGGGDSIHHVCLLSCGCLVVVWHVSGFRTMKKAPGINRGHGG